jgi:RsiW-degrading membrane proteinase PrsW (M82 family)
VFDVQSTVVAFIIGFIPTFAWLIFWLLEDRKHPEPERLIARAFIAGMIAVPLVIPFQGLVSGIVDSRFILVLLWSTIEEVAILGVAWVAVLRVRAVDEPLDVPIYLITAALGFAALENMLFILSPLTDTGVLDQLVTGNLRFVGATLIHTLSSAIIGGMLALAFYREWFTKFIYGLAGVILAIVLHALFNFSILESGADHLLTIFSFVWVGIVFLLLALERVKLLKRPAWWQKMFVNRKS